MEREKIEREIRLKESQIIDLKNFLASKDYQTIREMQGGEPMNEDTKVRCSEARININNLEKDIAELKHVLDNMTYPVTVNGDEINNMTEFQSKENEEPPTKIFEGF